MLHHPICLKENPCCSWITRFPLVQATTAQWRSQGLSGWASLSKMRKKISKVWGKIRKIDRNLRKNEESGTLAHLRLWGLATALPLLKSNSCNTFLAGLVVGSVAWQSEGPAFASDANLFKKNIYYSRVNLSVIISLGC